MAHSTSQISRQNGARRRWSSTVVLNPSVLVDGEHGVSDLRGRRYPINSCAKVVVGAAAFDDLAAGEHSLSDERLVSAAVQLPPRRHPAQAA